MVPAETFPGFVAFTALFHYSSIPPRTEKWLITQKTNKIQTEVLLEFSLKSSSGDDRRAFWSSNQRTCTSSLPPNENISVTAAVTEVELQY